MGPGGATVKTASPRQAGPPITAPDGITVYPIDITPCSHLALAEGDIQPRPHLRHPHPPDHRASHVRPLGSNPGNHPRPRVEAKSAKSWQPPATPSSPSPASPSSSRPRERYARPSPLHHQPALPRRPQRHRHPRRSPPAQQGRTRPPTWSGGTQSSASSAKASDARCQEPSLSKSLQASTGHFGQGQ